MGPRHAFMACLWAAMALVARVAGAQLPDEPTLGAPRVHLETLHRDVTLFRFPGAEERPLLGPAYRDRGVPVCRAPCDKIVDGRDGSYFFVSRQDTGGGAVPFRLRGTTLGSSARIEGGVIRF